jgi:hypothetical protein
VEVNSRRWGKQRLPERVTFADEHSYLRTLGKAKEAARFRDNLELTRRRCATLISFLRDRPLEVVEFAESWPGLVEVCCYLQLHPRPNLYARELPLSVDTKFVEHHQSVLTRLLKIALPKDAVVETGRFEEQFGLRFDEPQVRVRLLDESLRTQLSMAFDDFSIPIQQFQNLGWEKLRVLVSENKMTFLTLPKTPRSIAIWGAGNAAALLHSVSWLADSDLFYWGDIDVQGFEILARLREVFPKTQSMMMDITTMNRFRDLCCPGVISKVQIKQQLTVAEEKAYEIADKSNLRLEQERIPNQFARDIIRANFPPNIS